MCTCKQDPAHQRIELCVDGLLRIEGSGILDDADFISHSIEFLLDGIHRYFFQCLL